MPRYMLIITIFGFLLNLGLTGCDGSKNSRERIKINRGQTTTSTKISAAEKSSNEKLAPVCLSLQKLIDSVVKLKGENLRVYTKDIRVLTKEAIDSKHIQAEEAKIQLTNLRLKKDNLVYEINHSKNINDVLNMKNIKQTNCEKIIAQDLDNKIYNYNVTEFTPAKLTLLKGSDLQDLLEISRTANNKIEVTRYEAVILPEDECNKESKKREYQIRTVEVIEWEFNPLAEIKISAILAQSLKNLVTTTVDFASTLGNNKVTSGAEVDVDTVSYSLAVDDARNISQPKCD